MKKAREGAAEALSLRTEQRRMSALAALGVDTQAELGQFFTPRLAADLIATLPELPPNGRLRVLDPGAGSGSLSAALAARVLRECPGLELEIVGVELDAQVAEYLRETLNDIERTFAELDAKATSQVVVADYIDVSTSYLDRVPELDEPFDLVIMNPPYKKLGASSAKRRALSLHGAECPNLYAGFLALGVNAAALGGQLVAITPRSFANGPYFAQFRGFFLDRLSLDRLHVFESRSTVFADTGVLQENIIFSGTRDGRRESVVLSASRGHTDEVFERVVSYDEIIRPGDKDRFIRIPTGDADASVAQTMSDLPATIGDLGVNASTGRVVDFRSRECLGAFDDPGAVPLIYPGNLRGGVVEWPRDVGKAQGFSARDEKASKLLMPAGYYVVIKRFSAKEERRRVVAAVWDPTEVDGDVAFENHLNVIHSNGSGLDRDLAVGLSYWLNSSLVDLYFRTFSGHTQVNATDLKSLRFPLADELRSLGHGRPLLLPAQEEIDQLAVEILGVRGVAA